MNESFLEKVLLLLLTGVLTGLLVPEVAARVAESRYRRQKVFEAELQRQTNILSAQAELLIKIPGKIAMGIPATQH